MRHVVPALLVLIATAASAANQLTVDRKTVLTNGVVTISVTLEGAYATVDSVKLPLRNLEITGEPSVSSEFSWIDGQSRRTKVFRYRARPLAAGRAQVGPLVLASADARVTLPAVTIDVVADRAAESNDPAVILRELEASGRDPLFVVASADRTRVHVGEPIVVTWHLYNGLNVQQFRIVALPRFRDFWTEDIDVRSVAIEEVIVGDSVLQKVPIRRVAIAPLRSGRFDVSGITIEAAVMRRLRGTPLDVFEGTLEQMTYTSAGLSIDALPLPPGRPVDATGVLELTCGAPKEAGSGPVTIDVTLAGLGNVRAAAAPQFAGPLAGKVQIEELGVDVDAAEGFSMSRRWRYLIFPNESGALQVPPLTLTLFDTAVDQRRELRCGGGTVKASSATPAAPSAAGAETPPARGSWKSSLPAIAAGALVLIAVLLAVPRAMRATRTGREVSRLVRGSPAEVRTQIDERLGAEAEVLRRDSGERGEAYRALMSLLAAAERDQAIAANWRPEAKRRLRDLLET